MKTVVTHNSSFHTDDIFAVATLKLKLGNIEIIRSRDEYKIKSADYVVDAGFVYDPKNNRFDHHQTDGAGKRANGIPYASFGLVWKEFGAELTSGLEEAEIIDKKLVQPIDAADNGVSISTPLFEGVADYSIGDFFHSFIDRENNTEEKLLETFIELTEVAGNLLKREIKRAQNSVAGFKKVLQIFEQSVDKRLVILDEDISWQRALTSVPEPLFVIMKRPDGKWGVRTVPKIAGGFEPRKPFPAEWGGLGERELQDTSGIPDAYFCHKNLFLATAKSKEGAIALAQKAILS